MRELTVKQKEVLDDWFDKNKDKVGIAFDWTDCEYFSLDLFKQLEDINNTEILTQEVNRYISDKCAAEMYRR